MLEELNPVKQLRTCKVRTIKEGLDLKDQELLETYINDSVNWTPHKLSVALGSKGLKIDSRQIVSHRDKVCSCRDIIK